MVMVMPVNTVVSDTWGKEHERWRELAFALPFRCELIGIRKQHRRMAMEKTSCIMDRVG